MNSLLKKSFLYVSFMGLSVFLSKDSLSTELSSLSSDSSQNQAEIRLPDEILVVIFSYLTPKEVGNASGVSQQFRKIACDENSPLNKLKDKKEDYKGITLFCKKAYSPDKIKQYAQRVAQLKTNPFPDLINEENFQKAVKAATFFYYNMY